MIDTAVPCLVCELANSHGGDVAAIDELVDAFGNLDYPRKAIKFQIFSANTIALPDFAYYAVYQRLEVSAADWARIIARAARHGDVWIDVFDRHGVQAVADNLELIAGLKLQASVLENDEVLAALKSLDLSSLRVVLNVSGFELSDIQRLVDRFRTLSASIILQIGFQAYPTSLEDTGLQKISVLRAAFPGTSLGVADHADASSDFAQLAPLFAHLLGCEHIEKHFCIDRDCAEYDAYSALEPEQMQLLCNRLLALGAATRGTFVNEAERTYLANTVQLPVLRDDLGAGQRIKPEHLLFRRTAQEGIPWHQIEKIQQNRQVLANKKSSNSALLESDFRPARVAAIVACRMKSSRLPRKALLPIAGRSSVERCLDQCLAIAGVDQVILATSTLAEDAVLEEYRCNGKVEFWTGDPDDVITRYLGACDAFGVDIVVRITADNPLVSSEILGLLLDSHFATGADYTGASNAAVGTSGEIINTSALRTVIDKLGRAEHSEYMTWYLRNNPETFDINIVDLPEELVRDYRLTLDHQEDLDLYEEVFSRIGREPSAKKLAEVFAVLDDDPELAAMNSHISVKYETDQALIAMLNEKTRLP